MNYMLSKIYMFIVIAITIILAYGQINASANVKLISVEEDDDCYVCGYYGCEDQDGDQTGRGNCTSGMGICTPSGESCGGADEEN